MEEGRKVFFSGIEDKPEQDVGFLVHKDIVNIVMGCRPVPSRLITIRLRVPFSITVVQAYAPTSDYNDNEIHTKHSFKNQWPAEECHWWGTEERRLCSETGIQKWAGMFVETGKSFEEPSAMTTQMREDSDFLSLPPLTIFCWRPHLVIRKHQEDKPGIAQMDKTTIRSITF